MKLPRSIFLSFIGILALSLFPSSLFAGFDIAGWSIFRKVRSNQFNSIALTSPGYSDISAVLYNPAVAASLHRRELFVVSEKGFAEDSLNAALYSQPVGKSIITAGFAYYDAGNVELNWMDGSELKTETAPLQRDKMGILSFATPFTPDLYFGASLKAASSEIVQRNTAMAYAGDLGFFYYPTDNFTVSLAAQNLGTSTKFVKEANPLPTAGYIGTGYLARTINGAYVLTSAGASYYTTDDKFVPEAGVELGYNVFSVNAGAQLSENEASVHFGFGVRFNKVVVGYAFLPGTYLDATHRVTLSWQFDPAMRRKDLHMEYMPKRKWSDYQKELAKKKASAIKASSAVPVPRTAIKRSLKTEPQKALLAPATGQVFPQTLGVSSSTSCPPAAKKQSATKKKSSQNHQKKDSQDVWYK